MSTYAVRVEGQDGTRNVYFTASEVLAALKEYAQTTGDTEYAQVSVWEMRSLGSAGRQVSLSELFSR